MVIIYSNVTHRSLVHTQHPAFILLSNNNTKMSIKDKKSVISIAAVTTNESQKGDDYSQEKACDTVESDNSSRRVSNHKLSLEFRCRDTPYEQRKLCESFWKVIDQHPELDHIMARGWSEKDVAPKSKETKNKTPMESPCDELQDFLDHNVDKLVLWGLKNLNSECSTDLKLNQSSTHLFEGLQDFDGKVKTEISIPPKAPRPTRSEQDMILKTQLEQIERD